MKKARCRSCNREIFWTTSPAGFRMPLTARPVTVYRITDATADEPHLEAVAEKPLYISHFIDCPNAAQHSKASR